MSDYGIVVQNSIAQISVSNINNELIAINSTYSSLTTSTDNSGNGNNVGLKAEQNGKINKYGSQPTGTTAEATETGGTIY